MRYEYSKSIDLSYKARTARAIEMRWGKGWQPVVVEHQVLGPSFWHGWSLVRIRLVLILSHGERMGAPDVFFFGGGLDSMRVPNIIFGELLLNYFPG